MPGLGKSGISRISCLSVFNVIEKNSIVARPLPAVQPLGPPPFAVRGTAARLKYPVPGAFRSRKRERGRRLHFEPNRADPVRRHASARTSEILLPAHDRKQTIDGLRRGRSLSVRSLQRIDVLVTLKHILDCHAQTLQSKWFSY